MSEQDQNKRIQEVIEASGGYIIKTITTNKSGTNDMLACIPVKVQDLLDTLWDMGMRPTGLPQYEDSRMESDAVYGRFCSLEGKVKGRILEQLQLAHQIKVIKAGGLAIRAETVKDALTIIKWAEEGYIQPLPEVQLKKFNL